MTKTVRPLSGRGTDIVWEQHGTVRRVQWGLIKFHLSQEMIEDLRSHYFIDADHWYPLGADMFVPMVGGLGEYLRGKTTLSPRHASAIAAILVSEGLLKYRGKKPIELRKQIAWTGENI